MFSRLQEEKNCGAPCYGMFFAESERTFLRYWVGSWAAVCCASCLFTVIFINEIFSEFQKKRKKLISGVSGFDIFNRSVTLSISRKSDCLSGNMLFSGWLCVRCWTWCWGFRFVSRTVSTAQSTERLTDDFNHNSGNFMFIQQMCIKDE